MYKGRHCEESDYILLVRETEKIISLLSKDIDAYSSLINYIDFISDFDEDIASKIRFHLDKDNLDKSKMIRVISRYVEELKRNVIVDIKEHH